MNHDLMLWGAGVFLLIFLPGWVWSPFISGSAGRMDLQARAILAFPVGLALLPTTWVIVNLVFGVPIGLVSIVVSTTLLTAVPFSFNRLRAFLRRKRWPEQVGKLISMLEAGK